MDGDGTPSTDVDARVAQLQHALTSRIVVEQAKGMLAERYALTPAEAYELIRLAARSNGLKVHAISSSVLGAPRETPAVILDLLKNQPKHTLALGRAVENVFHQVNESFLKLDAAQFVCECADASCTDSIAVSAETMRRLHRDRDLYVVRSAHVSSELEEVVEERDGFSVVRKTAAR